jgi:hypothetical protein
VPPIHLTNKEWLTARKRMLLRAYKLTDPYDDKDSRVAKAKELRDAAVEKALAPETKPWDPARHRTIADWLCDLVWSIHGNQKQSYRVTHASTSLDDEAEPAAPSSRDPERLMLSAGERARADDQEAALHQRIAHDALMVFLMEHASDVDPPEDDPEDADAPPRANAEAVSTRLALAKGYTATEIRSARKRLKFHMEAVAREFGKKRRR